MHILKGKFSNKFIPDIKEERLSDNQLTCTVSDVSSDWESSQSEKANESIIKSESESDHLSKSRSKLKAVKNDINLLVRSFTKISGSKKNRLGMNNDDKSIDEK